MFSDCTRRLTGYRIPALALCAFVALAASAQAQALNIVTSIHPVESIVRSVGGDAVTTQLLISDAASPHSFALKPSHLQALSQADLVVWVGPGIETFLPRALRATDTPHLQWGEDLGESDEHHDHHDHDHSGPDPHLWMAPDASARFAARVANRLSELEPQRAALFRANAKRFSAELASLDRDLTARFDKADAKPVAVVHNAYSHFTLHYGLPDPIALTDLAEELPSARDARRAKQALDTLDAGCVLIEPTTNPRWLRLLASDETRSLRRIDPIGRDIARGPDLYFTLLNNVADAFSTCSD